MANIEKAKSYLENIAVKSLEKSAASLKMMVRREVIVEGFELLEICDNLELEEEQEILVTTEIIGDVNGKSYLMLSKEAGDKIYEWVFGPKKASITTEVVMKEVDNIISASVISIIADSFQVEIFGDIPYYFNTGSDKARDMILDDCINYDNEQDKFLIKSKLVCGEENTVHMLFYWIISGEIIEKAEINIEN